MLFLIAIDMASLVAINNDEGDRLQHNSMPSTPFNLGCPGVHGGVDTNLALGKHCPITKQEHATPEGRTLTIMKRSVQCYKERVLVRKVHANGS